MCKAYRIHLTWTQRDKHKVKITPEIYRWNHFARDAQTLFDWRVHGKVIQVSKNSFRWFYSDGYTPRRFKGRATTFKQAVAQCIAAKIKGY